MRNILLAAALLTPALFAAPARAADPALVTGTEKYLRDDEKALLAALLTHPDLAAQFEGDAAVGLKDPKNLNPFLTAWRGRIVSFAETDSHRPNPDLEGHYQNYAQLMTPEQRAYMQRRIPTMSEDNRNSLIGYLNSVNDALQKNGQLTWYTKKVVAGIMDHYRTDLTTYLATPIAQTAKRDAPAATQQLADLRKADDASRVAATVPVVPPAATAPVTAPTTVAAKPTPKPKKPAATEPTTGVDNGAVVVNKPTGGALDQARNAAGVTTGGTTEDAAGRAGQVFDGNGAKQPTGGTAVVVPPNGGKPTGNAGLTPPSGVGGPKPSVVGSVPAPTPEDSFMSSISKMQTKPAGTPLIHHAPLAAGILLGGLLGFLLGGPIGALVGAAVGGLAGHLVAKKLFA